MLANQVSPPASGTSMARRMAAGRRFLAIGHVGVPNRLAGSQRSDGRATFNDIGDDVHLRLAGEPGAAELVDRGIVELAEALAERNLLLVRHLLVAEQQDQVLVPGTSDGFQRALVETSDVNAPHLGAKRGAGRHDLDPWLGLRPNALHAGKVRFRVLLVKRPARRRARNGRWNRARGRASCAPSAPRRRFGRSADPS